MSGDSAADGRAPLPAGGGSSAPQNPPKKSLGPPGKAPNLERRAIIRPHSFREWDKSESVLDLQGLAKLLPEIDGERAQKLIQCSTNRLIETLQKINPDFKYEAALNPRRILTNPAAGVGNGGMDNQNADLIIAVNDIIVNQSVSGTCKRYRVVDTLGQGTFGQVIKCEDLSSKELRAIKIIKNKPAYTNQALIEVKILHVLNDVYDPHDKCHIVRIHEHFYFKNHLCIATELVSFIYYLLVCH